MARSVPINSRNAITLLALCTQLLAVSARSQDGRIVERRSVALADSTADRLERSRPGTREALAAVTVSKITYLSDGLRVKAYLVAPKATGRYPCLIANRGGNREFSAWTDARAATTLAHFASWGYVVVASQYRGVSGGEGREEFGGADVHDVLNLLPVLAAQPSADTSRIGMWGWSRGGMETYLALKATCRMKAAVVGSGESDLFLSERLRPEMRDSVHAELIPDFDRRHDEVLAARSAVRWPEQLCPTTPLLILQGTADWRVPPEGALNLVSKLQALKRPVRFVLLEGGQHSLVEWRDEVDRLTRDFLDRYVRDEKSFPDLAPHGP